jgi:hypothetical protein
MSLADDVQELRHNARRAAPCKTGIWLAGLDERDRHAFMDYVADRKPLAALWKMALKNDCEAGLTQFKAHCNQACSCHRIMENAA